VLVPFGARRVVGVVVERAAASSDPRRLRRVEQRLDAVSVYSDELWHTLHWAARYYLHPLGEVLLGALPVALRRAGPVRDALPLALRAAPGAAAGRSARRRALLEALASGPRASSTLLADGHSAAELRRALRAGLVEGCALPWALRARAAPPPLNDAQQAAAEALAVARDRFGVFLLHGVTGSGKTEVYLDAIGRALDAGRQALVLVPEIGLTPQALRRYRQRLGVEVAALHSQLADGERARTWAAAGRGEVPVVLGTRSAVFTPLARPGLIVVDEEHDGSYKQLEGLRYHARDLAVVRARALGIPIVLGSATPALETLANAGAGRYATLRLPERAGRAAIPEVRMIDLRRQRLDEGLSAPLLDAIGGCLARGEQALVFRNRRGYAPVLLCHACGWHAECPRCDVPLTMHRAAAELRCHHCGHRERMRRACPDCGGGELLARGAGTERLHDALRERFPGVPVHRLDRDTAHAKDAVEHVLAELEHGQAAIVVGTQMLAKGHDLPNLTLAAIVDGDAGLYSADFRAAERLAQLIIQVAGRAGRGRKPGTVWLQTHQPAHPLFERLLGGGYAAFAEHELEARATLGFPPFVHLALLRAEAKTEAPVSAFLERARMLLATDGEVVARGPMPAPMSRRAGFRRGQLLFEARQRTDLHAALAPALEALRAMPEARRVRWSLDVDPVDLY
jgi:primosomal protein N' (replication factor Y)